VKAAGVNFPDTLIIADKYQFKPPRPFAPGHEVAGDITEVGEGVGEYKVGQRVIGMIGHGGYATEVVADQGQLLPMPDNMSYEDGAAFTMTYGTSYYALKQRSDIKPGETLLVTGASGGVGLTAVELGALMGLKVIAAVGSDEKMEVCRKYGATMFVNYAKDKMRDKVKELTGGNGADIIYDAVGGDAFDESIRCIAWYGRLLLRRLARARTQRGTQELRRAAGVVCAGQAQAAHLHALPAGEGARRHERAAVAQGDGQGRAHHRLTGGLGWAG
jgi:NADPH:quinone reductase